MNEVVVAPSNSGMGFPHMKSGQYGVVTESVCSSYIGAAVLRTLDRVVMLRDGGTWPTTDNGIRVRILQPGEVVTIKVGEV